MMLVCSFKVTLGKRIVCERNNIMHYIMLKPVQTYNSRQKSLGHLEKNNEKPYSYKLFYYCTVDASPLPL